ncbi:YfhO family protein [Nocardia mexicana]|uniref:YfhO family protein n=1 Tax=Nocardia mexicana TaxID=279262 RepID=UPI001FE63E59|nr:YfhO family protein [Nocardia mexicana]
MVAGYASVLLANPRHFYTDDTEAQYAPLWVMLGRHLREGRFPALVPWEWMSGNYSMEEAGLYNPPQMLVDFIAPSVDNLAVYATVVKLVFSIVAALGVFRICLAYGSKPAWGAVAGVGFTLSGWFLFFDEASWATSLAGTAWMLHAWASAVRYTRGRGGPIPVFVFLYLAISVQYIFPAVESAIMIVAVAVGEFVYLRAWRPVLRLMLAAGCAGLAGLSTFLPSMLSSSVTWRGNQRILNDSFLDVPWSESLNASLPSTVPAFEGWWGYVQPLPMVYIAWFLIPLLAFIDWRGVRRDVREFTGPALFALIFLMWTAGPGRIGPLRWPARVLPMLAIGLLVLVCVLLSRYGTFADWRRRGIAAAVLIGLLFVRTFSAAPHLVVRHLVAVVVVAALTAAVVWAARARGTALACVLAILAMFPITYDQVRAQGATPMSYHFPERRSDMSAAFPDFSGVTLQLADRALVAPQDESVDRAWGSLAFGNYAKAIGLDYVNAYSPIGHRWFSDMLCMGWNGSTCPDAYRRAFTTEPTTGRTIVDLMKVDRVVLQRAQYPDARNHPAPPGWNWIDYPGHERYIWVLERVTGPISTHKGLPADTRGVTATSVARDSFTSHLRVSSDTGGRVVFARLAWPGYRATLNGHDIAFDTVAKTFAAVDIPPGTRDADLVLTWRPPGWKIGIATALAGLLGLGVLQWAYRRNRYTDPDTPGDDPADTHPDREPGQLVPASA